MRATIDERKHTREAFRVLLEGRDPGFTGEVGSGEAIGLVNEPRKRTGNGTARRRKE